VDDSWHVQEPDVMQFEAERTACQVHLIGHLDEPSERNALQRHGMTAPERVQVDAVAMIRRDHCQAG
jgi:hypothetical protein